MSLLLCESQQRHFHLIRTHKKMKQFTKEEIKEIFKNSTNLTLQKFFKDKDLKDFCQYQVDNSDRHI